MIKVNNNGSVLNRSVLVLNTNYAPLDICTAKRAICLFFNEKVEILESYHESVHSPSTALSLPSIIKGNRTPAEAKMPLNRKPAKPNKIHYFQKFIHDQQVAWKPYLFMESF